MIKELPLMRLAIASVLAIAGLACAAAQCGSNVHPAIPVEKWVYFRSPDGSFEVTLPGLPAEIQGHVPMDVAQTKDAVFHGYACVSTETIYSVLSDDIPLMGDTPTPETFDKLVRSQAQALKEGRLVEERSFTIGGYEGREFAILFSTDPTASFPAKKARYDGRVLAVDRRLYVLEALHEVSVDDEKARAFLGSFTLLAPPQSRVTRMLQILCGSLVLAFRFLLFCFGVIAILTALLALPSELERYEVAFAEFWKRVDARRSRAPSRSASFLREASSTTGACFDRLLGTELFSLQSVTVITSFAITSATLVLWWYDYQPHWWGLLVVSTVPAIATAFVRSIRTRNVLLVFVWVLLLYPSPFLRGELRIGGYFFILASTLAGIVLVGLNRKILRGVSVAPKSWQAVLLGSFNLLAGVVLAGPVVAATLIRTFPSAFLVQIRQAEAIPLWLRLAVVQFSFLNVLTAMAGFSIFLVAALALFHRLFWPTCSRLLSSLPEFLKGRTTRVGLGVTCIATGLKPDWLLALSKFWKIFGG